MAKSRKSGPQDEPEQKRYRAIFISDIHLGTKGCKAEFLLDFLKYNDADTFYLVGDIIDGWRLKKSWYWPQSHNDVIQKLLRKARKGAKVYFIPGNHDEFARSYCDAEFGDITVAREMIHETPNGKRYLIIHGDEFDGVVQYAKWLAKLGDVCYVWLLATNHWFNRIRYRIGMPYWSLSQYLKHKVKNIVKFVADFEESMAELARARGVDGIICGHIHHAEKRDIDGIAYFNDGDWVESCTALVEDFDGRMDIVHWAEERKFSYLTASGSDDNDSRKQVAKTPDEAIAAALPASSTTTGGSAADDDRPMAARQAASAAMTALAGLTKPSQDATAHSMSETIAIGDGKQ